MSSGIGSTINNNLIKENHDILKRLTYTNYLGIILDEAKKLNNLYEKINELDFKEFEITPRVIRKAEKHWNHYSNNIKHDEVYEIRKSEVEEILADLSAFLER